MVRIEVEKCSKCGICIKSCVTDAINPKKGLVNNNRCIKCSHCIAVCPNDAVFQNDSSGEYIDSHNISPESFSNLIFSRKSIRNFKPVDISDETLKEFLALMQYAPTGTNSQKTYVTVINNKNRVNDFSILMMNYFRQLSRILLNPLTYPFLILILGLKKVKKFLSYKKAIVNVEKGKDILCFNCPMVIIFHASPDASTPDMDCNIQASYASLHAVTLGLGTCFNGFITKGLNLNNKLKKQLGIPKKNKVYSSLLVGYPELEYKKKVIREQLKVNIFS